MKIKKIKKFYQKYLLLITKMLLLYCNRKEIRNMIALLIIFAFIITIQFCKYRELEERLEKEIKHSVLLENTIKEIIESKEN